MLKNTSKEYIEKYKLDIAIRKANTSLNNLKVLNFKDVKDILVNFYNEVNHKN